MLVKTLSKKEIRKWATAYARFVYWDEEEGIYIGQCPELFGGGVHGKDEAKAYAELLTIIEEVVEDFLRDGRPLPKGKALSIVRATMDAVAA